jgi:hypothetical protein
MTRNAHDFGTLVWPNIALFLHMRQFLWQHSNAFVYNRRNLICLCVYLRNKCIGIKQFKKTEKKTIKTSEARWTDCTARKLNMFSIKEKSINLHATGESQDCQISVGTTYQNGNKYTK